MLRSFSQIRNLFSYKNTSYCLKNVDKSKNFLVATQFTRVKATATSNVNKKEENAHNQSDSNSNENQNTVNFGFEQVDEEAKQGKVNEVFDNVASKYDVMNDAMSFGLHRVWKDIFIRQIEPNENMKLIDVAGGTGDIAFRYLTHLKYSSLSKNVSSNQDDVKVTVCDINQNMLNVGMQRAKAMNLSNQIRWQQGNAESLTTEKDNSYDVYTIAFGIRNCTNLENVVKEAYRILKPGGRFVCLEFSQTENEAFKWVYDLYSFNIIPAMGYLIAGDWKSYQYLVESIRVFPNQKEFARLISDCGFKQVTFKNLTNGVVAIHSGFKF